MLIQKIVVKKILIADSGSTKTDWVKLSTDDNNPIEYETFACHGLNPVIIDSSEIAKELDNVRVHFGNQFDSIRFYGAGVGNPQMVKKIEECLANSFDCKDIKADSDMAGAAKAVLGNQPGIACIMGTGSNSCHYNGEKTDRKTASLGYILDDNGGGVAFGRRLLSDVFKNYAPEEIRNAFHERYRLTVPDVIENIYRKPASNRWIAGFMPFVIEHRHHPYMATMIAIQLQLFLDREFVTYTEKELKEEGIGFVGSVATLLSRDLQDNLECRGWKLRGIMAKPLDALICNDNLLWN